MSQTAIVVPCYNEAERLDGEAFTRFARSQPGVRFTFVNDGSTDATLERLERLRQALGPGQADVIDVRPNAGKAAAVRRGVLAALDGDAERVGFWDADLATPLDEIPAFVAALDARPELLLVFGSRQGLPRRQIARSTPRYYAGRLFARLAAAALQLPIHDTQCGAKLFRTAPVVRQLFEEPFHTNWSFDVELLARLIRALGRGPALERAYLEVPLRSWYDVAGSKVRSRDLLTSLFEIARIRRAYLR